MKALRLLLRVTAPALLAGLLLTGCFVESLHPIYDKAVPPAATDPALLGTWQTDKGADDKPASLAIADQGDNRYSLKYTEDGKTTELRGALVQVGSQRYLDVWIEQWDQFQLPLAASAHLAPTHSFWKVSRDGDTLTLARLDYDRLKESIEKHKAAPDYTVVDDDFLVLTGTPARLRDFLQKYATDPAVFAKTLVFHRQK
ncbi:MAG TPA: hypothetical protein VEG08_12595 [Terriglobales bacterium]|nr:hypothetical protein [Terriglobales bacterium]